MTTRILMPWQPVTQGNSVTPTSATVTLAGQSSVTATGLVLNVQSANTSGSGSITASGVPVTILSQSASVSGQGSATGSSIVINIQSATVHGAGNVTANSESGSSNAVTVSGAGSITANAEIITVLQVSISGGSSVTASSVFPTVQNVSVGGVGTLTIYTQTPLGVHVKLNGDFITSVTLAGEFVTTVTLQGTAGDGTVTVKGQDFEIYAGESRTISVPEVVDKDGKPVDLSASTVTWTIIDRYGNTILTKPATADANGNVTIQIAHSDTVGLKVGDYRHKAEIVDQQGNDGVSFVGKFSVLNV